MCMTTDGSVQLSHKIMATSLRSLDDEVTHFIENGLKEVKERVNHKLIKCQERLVSFL